MGRAKQLGKAASIREGRTCSTNACLLDTNFLYRACFSQAFYLNQPPQKHSVNKVKGKDHLKVSRAMHVGFSPPQQYIPDYFFLVWPLAHNFASHFLPGFLAF